MKIITKEREFELDEMNTTFAVKKKTEWEDGSVKCDSKTMFLVNGEVIKTWNGWTEEDINYVIHRHNEEIQENLNEYNFDEYEYDFETELIIKKLIDKSTTPRVILTVIKNRQLIKEGEK